MKIARVESFFIGIPYDHGAPKPIQTSGRERTTMDAVYVKVTTDAGVVGWGEAYGFGACAVTLAALRKVVGPLAEGRDLGEARPADIALLMLDLRRKTQSQGLNGPVSFAVSGLDIALWDVAGKVAGKPVHRLLGASSPKGGNRQRVPAYASMLKLGTREHLDRVLNVALQRGYRHVKLHEKTVEAVATAREIVGRETPLMLDVNCAFTAEEAHAVAERLKPYDLDWFEEPIFPPDDYAALARLGKIGVPIAVGENLGDLNEVRRLLKARAVDVVQPDVCKMGGITETWKALALAREMGVAAEPHSPYYGPGLIASVHLLAAMEAEALCEYFFADLEASPCGAAAIPKDGFLAVPQGPGLGIAVDEGLVRKYCTRQL